MSHKIGLIGEPINRSYEERVKIESIITNYTKVAVICPVFYTSIV